MSARVNDHRSVMRVKVIATRTFSGELDPLLAARELAGLRLSLPEVPEGAWDTFVAVASEVDGLPIGDERKYWAADALKAKDVEAADYRERVKEPVTRALEQLLAVLER